MHDDRIGSDHKTPKAQNRKFFLFPFFFVPKSCMWKFLSSCCDIIPLGLLEEAFFPYLCVLLDRKSKIEHEG